MRRARSSAVVAGCLAMLLAGAAGAQETRGNSDNKTTKPLMIGSSGPIEIYRAEHSSYTNGSASITEDKIQPDKKASYLFRNTGDKDIVGFAAIFSLGETRRLLYPEFFDDSGKKSPWLPYSYFGGRDEVWAIEIDYVLFADGTGWGPDLYERSKVLQQYQRGRKAARARVKELAAGFADDAVKEAFNGLTMISWGASLPLRDSDTWSDRRSFMTGYNNALSPLERGGDTAKVLAARVKALANTP